MRNVRSNDPKIDETSDKMAGVSEILKRLPISGPKVNTKLYRSVHAQISKTSVSKDILNVLLLVEVVALRRRSDLNPEKLTKRTQIRHQKLFTETLLHKINVLKVIPSNDHIIHIEEERPTLRRGVQRGQGRDH